MEDEQLKRRDHYPAGSVPGIPSSLMNAATPVDEAPPAPHLDGIESRPLGEVDLYEKRPA